MPDLSAAEFRRYARHLMLPDVGSEGQARLRDASVLLVGAGGLGSPMALYLAAAGIGRLGLVDFDTVDESNLQRQVLYGSSDIGRPKLESAVHRLREVNPHVAVVPFPVRLDRTNALEILSGFDVVADGTDNFSTRYLVNDACVLTGIPNVYGSIYRFEGQVSVFGVPGGPCYRCVFPEPPPPGLVPSCAESGVLGVLPGTVGTIQATEVLKLLLGIGEPLVGRMLSFDALGMDFRSMTVPPDPLCPVCGTHPSISELQDYEAFCNMTGDSSAPSVGTMTVRELKGRIDEGDAPFVLDVRQPYEAQIATLGAPIIPLDQLESRLGELEAHRDGEIVLMCRTGVRSLTAAHVLLAHGFRRPLNLVGGIRAWSEEIDPTIAVY